MFGVDVDKQEERLKCRECVESVQTSKVYIEHRTRTALASVPFWDEDGNYHNDDPNTTTTRLRCSNGHTWEVES